MLISCNRLKSYIKDSEDIDFVKVWDIFTMRTAEVENVVIKGEDLKDVVTAKIVSCEKHPDSNKLSLLKVSDGNSIYDIVCGAPNVRVGLIGALVKVGGMVSGMKITSRKLAGYVSNGMMCAWDELGIGSDHSGILELPSDTPLGVLLTDLYPIKDIIVEIDNKSLTNRPDLWGHYGIAREIASITNHKLLDLPVLEVVNDKNDLDIKVLEPLLCPRYCGIKVSNLKNNTTPIDMQIFLSYVGMRSISLFVDLTNYLMLELGQPMHAFDERVVKNIVVKKANDGDTYTTLDKVERKLNSDNLMITNGDEYFGIAGVMGGLDSEILPDTDSIFIESANFQAGSIRKTAVSLGLRTDASAHYEKSLDPNMCDFALKRLLYLLKGENPDMEIMSNLTDIYPNPLKEKEVVLYKKNIGRYTTLEISDDEVKKILESLGFKVKVNKDSYDIIVPTMRATKDISMEADIIEELIRMIGYDKIKELPMVMNASSKVWENVWDCEYNVKKLLASVFNLNEVHSYIWYEDEMLNKLGIIKNNVKLLGQSKNNILRDDLSLSLLPIVKNNFKNRSEMGIFEIGTVIKDNENHSHLTVLLASDESKVKDMYMKGKEIVEYLFKMVKHQEVSYQHQRPYDYYNEDKSLKIICDGKDVGYLLLFDSKSNRYVGKNKVVVGIDIDFNNFMNVKTKEIIFKEISKYPVVNLDYTILTDKDMNYDSLLNVLDGFNNKLIMERQFVDVYPNDDKLKYTICYEVGSLERTLTSEELEKFKNKFMKYIKEKGLEIIS